MTANNPTSPGFWPCKSDSRCDTCRRGHFCTSVESSKNGRKHQIQQPLTCKSKNICFLIHCKHCNQQYTGETQLEFHLRLNNNTSDIKLNKKSTGMVRHFGDCGVNNMQPVILEKVGSSDPFIRKAREQFYIDLPRNRNQCTVIKTSIYLIILDVNRLNHLFIYPCTHPYCSRSRSRSTNHHLAHQF